MSKLFVDEIVHQSSQGSGTITIGASGETINVVGTLQNNGSAVGGVNTPAFEAKLSGSQTVSSGTDTKIQLATEIFDTDNCYDNTTNYRFTPNVAGKYFVYVKANLQSSTEQMIRAIAYIFKNGSYSEYTDFMMPTSYYSRIVTGFYSKIVEMNGTTDYLEAYCYVTGSGTLSLMADNSHFGAYKIIE